MFCMLGLSGQLSATEVSCNDLAVSFAAELEAKIDARERSSGGCDLDELSLQVGKLLLAEHGDAFELRPLTARTAENTETGPAQSIILLSAGLTPDEKMFRVDWRIATGKPTGRVVARWFELQRSGWFWQTTRPVNAGDTVTSADVERRYGAVLAAHRISWDEWPGPVQANKSLSKGDVLLPTSVAQIPDLAAGDKAVFELQRGAILLHLDADVQEAAFVDQTVKLKLRHSGAIVYGRLQANNIVVPCDAHVLHARNVCTE